MRTTIIFAVALAAMPALAQPRLEVPVTITATEAMPTPLCFFFFCGLSLGTVPDGAGGFVPFTNSRVMPDGSLRPYDPAIDGLPPAYAAPLPEYSPYGPYPFPAPMPDPPAAYYDPPRYPPPPITHARRSRNALHQAGKACYDSRGQFIGADNEDCRHDQSPSGLPGSSGWVEPQ
jgi:hypothetical protein